MKPYEFLPHTADVRIVARGKDSAEAFGNAAYAMTDVVTDHFKIEKKIEKKIERSRRFSEKKATISISSKRNCKKLC